MLLTLALCLGALVTSITSRSASAAEPARKPSAQKLRISANRHYLEHADGRPFFYLGDTAWGLFQRLTREEADVYLADRAKKGFSVIQAVVLPGVQGDRDTNVYGEAPLIAMDPGRPNEAYFQHVDRVVRKAAELGLHVGMLPTWGRNWKTDSEKPIFTKENARSYGSFLGKRYREQPIIWILGGDNNPGNPTEYQIVEALAAGLKAGDGGTHLITFHPRGPGRSSDYLHKAPWLDFNMIQSSHGARDHDTGLFSEGDFRLRPAKPTVDGEPRYEMVPVGFYWANVDRLARFDDYDTRQAAYWSLLGGACGYTYGNNSIWQFWHPDRRVALSANVPWTEALDHPGAFQMRFVRRLYESRPFHKLEPRQSMIVDGPAAGGAKVRAARASDGSFAFVYSPRGEPFTIDQTVIKGKKLKELWYDPRYGTAYSLHTGTTRAWQTYTPPTSGRGCDWILIIEDDAERFAFPGGVPEEAQGSSRGEGRREGERPEGGKALEKRRDK